MGTVIQLSLGQTLGSALGLSVLICIVQWLLALWIKSRLETSIRHEYDKKLEDYKFSQLQRAKASLIADFFSKWTKYRGKEEEFLDKKELCSYYEELNKMSLEISMWLKDENLLDEIMSLFGLKESAPDVRTLTGKVRKLILELEEDKFDSWKIVIWPKGETAKRLFGK